MFLSEPFLAEPRLPRQEADFLAEAFATLSFHFIFITGLSHEVACQTLRNLSLGEKSEEQDTGALLRVTRLPGKPAFPLPSPVPPAAGVGCPAGTLLLLITNSDLGKSLHLSSSIK